MAAATAAAGARSRPDPIVQYVVIRRDLADAEGTPWPLGAVVAQGAHASVAAVAQGLDAGDEATNEYVSAEALGSMTKYVLGIDDEPALRKLSEKLHAKGIKHHLWVEQPEDVATALAAWPGRRSAVQKPFKGLKFA
eukprot:PRCOL_00004161-RA